MPYDTQTAEDAIRQRSYFIWEREGRPIGKEQEHWIRAKAELEAELEATIKAARTRASRGSRWTVATPSTWSRAPRPW